MSTDILRLVQVINATASPFGNEKEQEEAVELRYSIKGESWAYELGSNALLGSDRFRLGRPGRSLFTDEESKGESA